MNQFHCDYDEVVDLFRKYNVHVHSWDQKDKRVRPSIISHMVCDYRNVTQCSYATLAMIFNYSDRRIARQAAAASPFTTVKTGERICHDEEPWGEVRWDANFLVDFVGHSPTVIAKNAIKIIRSRYNVYDSVPATVRTRKGVKIPMAIKNEIIWYTQEYGMEVDDFMNIAATLWTDKVVWWAV